MARERDVDWSDWNGRAEEPEHPMSRPLDEGIKTGADAAAQALATGDIPVLVDAPKQPTDEQLFGHLEVTQEQADAAHKEWDTKISGFYKQDNLNDIDRLNGGDDRLDFEWEEGKSFEQCLREHEQKQG